MNFFERFLGGGVKVDDLHRRMAKGEKFFLLDVRTAQEYRGPEGRIPGAVLVPLKEIKQRGAEAIGEFSGEVIAICSHGLRSRVARSILIKQGLRPLSLSGGMKAWAQKGYELIVEEGDERRCAPSAKRC